MIQSVTAQQTQPEKHKQRVQRHSREKKINKGREKRRRQKEIANRKKR